MLTTSGVDVRFSYSLHWGFVGDPVDRVEEIPPRHFQRGERKFYKLVQDKHVYFVSFRRSNGTSIHTFHSTHRMPKHKKRTPF